jgi:hypothetical protein
MADPTDINATDTAFGKAAKEKAEEADRLMAEGKDPLDAAEGSGVDPRPRAGGKASSGAPPAADVE